jgi:hypothetical protein
MHSLSRLGAEVGRQRDRKLKPHAIPNEHEHLAKGNTMAEETKHSAGEIRFHDETVQLDRGVIQRTNFDWAGGVVGVSTSDYRWDHHQAQLTARITTSMFVTKVTGDDDSVTITLADMRHRKLYIQINGSCLAEMLEMVMTDEDADDE